MNLIEELTWRGMIHQTIPGTEKLLATEKVTGYLGTDPTADSLHIGNLASLMLLVHLQRHGHQPIALVGGATGMVGDPSGKSTERELLTEEKLAHNLAGIRKDLEGILDFDCADNPALIMNNFNWFKDMPVLEFLRDVGKHLTVNVMMSKDSVKNRMETGISFTEFSYQLIQGYDFYYLWKNHNCKIQFGGSDQWGNITAGTELIRRMGGPGSEAFAVTAPLIMKSDGTKFGKSASGAVWLNPERTSPYQFYQFWRNASDDDAPAYLKKFTLKSKEEIDDLVAQHEERPGTIQPDLAHAVTSFIHGEEAANKAEATAKLLFGKGTKESLFALSAAEILEAFEGVPTFQLSKEGHGDQLPIVDFLTELTGILPSKSEARRALKENSLSINLEKVNDSKEVSKKDLIQDRFIYVTRGKKKKFLVDTGA